MWNQMDVSRNGSLSRDVQAAGQRPLTCRHNKVSELKVSAVVGTLLTAINQGDLLLKGRRPPAWKVGLTYCVPFCVATYGAVRAKQRLERGP
eukprot:COSAG04_NODE_10310_length_787_cov_1.318314_2_plen_92_part_00